MEPQNFGERDTLGVYVSVPFCRAKCSFCNFASGVGTSAALESYVTRLCAEIETAAEAAEHRGAKLPHVVDTIYFGGGTPSLLAPAQLRRVFAGLRRSFDVTPDAEITVEAAPGQIAEDVLEEAQRLGVNRVSLGVQSFVDAECAAVGRLHSGRECVREIERLGAAGLAEIGADLIAGLPYQTKESWAHSLEVAHSLGAEGTLTHLSIYMLEVDQDSRLGREVMSGGQRFHAPSVPADDLAAEFYEMACDQLADRAPAREPEDEKGFAQYEISNFAALGSGVSSHRSRHNVKYWRRDPYIGFGLDAHSMLYADWSGGSEGSGSLGQAEETYRTEGSRRSERRHSSVRFANVDDLGAYMRGSGAEVVRVGESAAFEETVFLGLRMNEGIVTERLRSEFPEELVAPCEDAAQELLAEGLMVEKDGCWMLTLRGRLMSNEVFGRLLIDVLV